MYGLGLAQSNWRVYLSPAPHCAFGARFITCRGVHAALRAAWQQQQPQLPDPACLPACYFTAPSGHPCAAVSGVGHAHAHHEAAPAGHHGAVCTASTAAAGPAEGLSSGGCAEQCKLRCIVKPRRPVILELYEPQVQQLLGRLRAELVQRGGWRFLPAFVRHLRALWRRFCAG